MPKTNQKVKITLQGYPHAMRDFRIISLLRDGNSMRKVGSVVGVSHQRVAKIAQRFEDVEVISYEDDQVIVH